MQIVVAKLGDRDKGFIPSNKMFEQFRTGITQAIQDGGKTVLAMHPFVSFQTVDIPDGAKVVVAQDIEDEGRARLLTEDRVIEIVNRTWNLHEETRKLLEASKSVSWWKRLFG